MISIMLFLSVLIILSIVVVVAVNEPYIMTLGDYGHKTPEHCSEVVPVGNICRSCNLDCSNNANCRKCAMTLC